MNLACFLNYFDEFSLFFELFFKIILMNLAYFLNDFVKKFALICTNEAPRKQICVLISNPKQLPIYNLRHFNISEITFS
jgi:hypothetical protein